MLNNSNTYFVIIKNNDIEKVISEDFDINTIIKENVGKSIVRLEFKDNNWVVENLFEKIAKCEKCTRSFESHYHYKDYNCLAIYCENCCYDYGDSTEKCPKCQNIICDDCYWCDKCQN